MQMHGTYIRRLWTLALLTAVVCVGGIDSPVAAAADDSLWPHQLTTYGTYAPSGRNAGKPAVIAWTPPGAKRLRALLIVPENTDSLHFAEHAALRAVAKKHEMGIVYMRHSDEPEVQGILDALAEKTGIREFRHAPWIPFGKSSRGMFPIVMEWKHARRTIAGVSYHAETPTWPPGPAAKLAGETILHVNANGETEWGGTWFVHVRPSLLNYRAQKNWLPQQVVVKGVGHGDYPDAHGSAGWGKPFPDRVTCIRVWDYLALYIDKAIGLRVPKDRYPTDGLAALKPVDETAGYLVDPFAVEELFQQPHYPLNDSPTGYLVGTAGEQTTSGFAAIPPAKGFRPAEGVPVAPLGVGRSPAGWLVTESMGFAMKNDPMTKLAGLENLRPQPGEQVQIDDFTATFGPLDAKLAGRNGGLALGSLKQGSALTLLAYTVVEVPKAGRWKLRAPFTVAGRLQIVLGGVPVEHKQVVELQPGLYPMLLVLRLTGVKWNAVEPWFEDVGDEEVRQAKEYAVEKAKRQAELEKRRAQGPTAAAALIRKAADVPPEQRQRMFWLADRELAEAWFRLHAPPRQEFDVPW